METKSDVDEIIDHILSSEDWSFAQEVITYGECNVERYRRNCPRFWIGDFYLSEKKLMVKKPFWDRVFSKISHEQLSISPAQHERLWNGMMEKKRVRDENERISLLKRTANQVRNV